MRRRAGGIAAAHGVTATVTLTLGPPPIVNPERPAAWARQAMESLLGVNALMPLGITNMAGEDFAYYMERIPGASCGWRARMVDDPVICAHAPQCHAAEGSVFLGAAVLAEAARVASAAVSE